MKDVLIDLLSMNAFIREGHTGETFTFFRRITLTRETAVGVVAAGLGMVGGASLLLILLYWMGSIECASWVYAAAMYLVTTIVPFHLGEWFTASHYRPRVDGGPKAFLLVNTPAYTVAAVLAIVEFTFELLFIPDSFKLITTDTTWLVTLAGILTLSFYAFRVVSMAQCGGSFSHQIETEKRQEHTLVTKGLYSFVRHPSYFGWFWRTAFCQIILMNPVCFVGYIVVTWKFFEDRIGEEEELLESREFFGREYTLYKRRVPTYIPFLK